MKFLIISFICIMLFGGCVSSSPSVSYKPSGCYNVECMLESESNEEKAYWKERQRVSHQRWVDNQKRKANQPNYYPVGSKCYGHTGPGECVSMY